MSRAWELTIYRDGAAVLTDDDGETVWTSDNDDEFAAEFEEFLTIEDGDDIADYLEDCDIIPEGIEVDIVEADSTGLHQILDLEDEEGQDGPEAMQ